VWLVYLSVHITNSKAQTSKTPNTIPMETPSIINNTTAFLLTTIATFLLNLIMDHIKTKLATMFKKKPVTIPKFLAACLPVLKFILPIILILWGTLSKNIPFDKWFVVSISLASISLVWVVMFKMMSSIIENQKVIIKSFKMAIDPYDKVESLRRDL